MTSCAPRPATALEGDNPGRDVGRQGVLAGQASGRHARPLELGDQHPGEDTFRGLGKFAGVVAGESLERRVDRRAARSRLDRLVRPLHRAKPQDVAGVDAVGVAHPALDAGDGQLPRPHLDGRRRARARRRAQQIERGLDWRVEGARPVGQLRPARQGRPAPLGCAIATAIAHDWTAGAPPRRSLCSRTTSGAQAAWAKSCADKPIRRSGDGRPAVLRIGRDRKGSIGAAAGRACLLEPGQHQHVGPARKARLDGAEDAQTRVRAGARAHRLPGDQGLQEVGELFGRNGGQALALLDQGGDHAGHRLAAEAGPEATEVGAVLARGEAPPWRWPGAGAEGGRGGLGRSRQVDSRVQRVQQVVRLGQGGEKARRNLVAVFARPPRGDQSPRDRGQFGLGPRMP